MKVAIAGTGYVGLVTGVCLAKVGHKVICADIDAEKVNRLNAGKAPIFEEGLEELMQEVSESIEYTTDSAYAYRGADVIIIGVGTPERDDGSADLAAVYSVAEEIVRAVNSSVVVAVKSTVPMGTCEKVEKHMRQAVGGNIEINVVSNPEFLSQGTAIADTFEASRIVIGADNNEAMEIMCRVYEPFDIRIVKTSRKSAEMIKYASNNFLALRISYINEIANLCEYVGADINDVALGMGLDKRIGLRFLRAGIGYGGSCFPKDTKALYWQSGVYGAELKTIKSAIDVNETQKFQLIKKARRYYSSFSKITVTILGLTFKPETDDLREAPSLKNVPIFLDENARVKVWDPVANEKFKRYFGNTVEYCETIEEAITNSDLCLIMTEWKQIAAFDLNKYSELMTHPIIIDGRNCYNIESVENKGIIYESIGRQTVIGNL